MSHLRALIGLSLITFLFGCFNLPGPCEPGEARCNANGDMEYCSCRDNGQFLIGNCRTSRPNWRSVNICDEGTTCVQRNFERGSTAACVEQDQGDCLNGVFEEECLSSGQARVCRTLTGPNYDYEAQTNRGIITTDTCDSNSVCNEDISGFAGCWWLGEQ